MTDYLAGLLLGLGLIMPIGPQNVFVVSQGPAAGLPRALWAESGHLPAGENLPHPGATLDRAPDHGDRRVIGGRRRLAQLVHVRPAGSSSAG
ncbi:MULTISPECIES: hypothetical protein [unclassified Micromonospora]|uniref:hypothetical protein n=1 Tax=unclassified Micromonospora TaxID=2617518 RepID=UPI003A89CED5